MEIHSLSEQFIYPLEYIQTPNHYTVIEIFQCTANLEFINTYLEEDFNKNFKQFNASKEIINEIDEFHKMLYFRDNSYPYFYFFICMDETEFSFMDKLIFTTELIDLFDISEKEKESIYRQIAKCNYMIVKLSKRLRNINLYPIPNITRLKEISLKIDFKEMYSINLELFY